MANLISRDAAKLTALALLALAPLRVFPATYSNPVLPGDYPDPSAIRWKQEYWATATSSEWGPFFPLLRSTNLVNWQTVGHVFPHRPAWATGNFWAPEIWTYRDRVYVYYVGRKRQGPLSIAVATADRPEGPYTDHGPLISQDAGSIDALPVLDENGKPFLIWKEDGNSRRLPTPLWIQALTPDATQLVGERREIMRNDRPWEGNLVEGPFVLRRNDWFYMFYSGNGCCGRGCTYALGVARAKQLFGPWEKFSNNPILSGNSTWACPGHGSIITLADGRDFLLYHAYPTRGTVYIGREGLLDLIEWKADGWPALLQDSGPSATAPAPFPSAAPAVLAFQDDFSRGQLHPEWQWPQAYEPQIQFDAGGLVLTAPTNAPNTPARAVLALRATATDYAATVQIDLSSLAAGGSAGLAAYGDPENAIGLSVDGKNARLWELRQRNLKEIAAQPCSPGQRIHLRLKAAQGHRFQFEWSADAQSWHSAGPNADLEGQYLPPWDRGVRIALISAGGPARFRSFHLAPGPK